MAELKQEGFCKLEITHTGSSKAVAVGQRQRPKEVASGSENEMVTSKSLADYVSSGVDAETLKEEMEQRLTQTPRTARDIALLEKALMDEGKIMGPTPYKVLKAEFCELIKVARQVLNRNERALNLR